MKCREKLGYIALGGFLTLMGIIAGNLTPLTAQKDTFGKITCTGLNVVNLDGKTAVELAIADYGGTVAVRGKDGKIAAAMTIEEYGGTVVVSGNDRKSTAGMNINEEGGNVAVSGKQGKSTAGMGITVGGGAVFVQDRYGGLKILD
ncbi:MAG: hypothetical protein OXN17_21470 [Candidatus Poribacteria bacterium]|nr:hypothetical protein [Candidatus Poribacteria bacterium]